MERIKQNIDLAGLFTSGLCALHCIALPVVLSFGMLEGVFVESAHHFFELSVYGITLVLASTAVLNGIKRHSNKMPLALFLIGFFIVSIGFGGHSDFGHGIMACGGVIIAIAHFVNYRLLRPYHIH